MFRHLCNVIFSTWKIKMVKHLLKSKVEDSTFLDVVGRARLRSQCVCLNLHMYVPKRMNGTSQTYDKTQNSATASHHNNRMNTYREHKCVQWMIHGCTDEYIHSKTECTLPEPVHAHLQCTPSKVRCYMQERHHRVNSQQTARMQTARYQKPRPCSLAHWQTAGSVVRPLYRCRHTCLLVYKHSMGCA